MKAAKNYRKAFAARRVLPALASLAAFASGAGFAQQAAKPADAKDTEQLETVTVTATKRVEPLQSVPVAITVMSGDKLEQLNLNNMSTITSQVPTLNFRANASNKDTALFIRGVGTISTSPGVEPTVSTVVDGVVFPRPGMATLDLMDVERIEVLRGPQGTLFGKNASAGVINIVSKPIQQGIERYVDASYFDGREYRLRAGVSGEISQGVLASLNLMSAEWDGNVDNKYLNRKVNGYDRQGGRVKFEIATGKDSKLTLIGDYVKADDTGIRGPFVRAGAAQVATIAPIVPGLELRQVSTDVNERVDDKNTGLSAQLDWKWGGNAMTWISAWREWKNTQFQDIDGTAPTPQSNQIAQLSDRGDLKSKVFTQELRLASPKGAFFDYVLGLYYMNNKTDETYRRDVVRCNGTLPALANGLTPCAALLNDFGRAEYGTESKSASIFGEGVFNFSKNLRGILGLRYTDDELSYYHSRVSTAAAAIPGVQPNRPYASATTNEKGTSGRIGPQFDLTPNVGVYATYSKGYKGPAYNAFFNMQPNQEVALAPEKSDSYELGLKSTLLDNRMRFNVAIFDAKYKGYQANFPDLVGGVVVTRFINAGDVSTKGAEIDMEAKLSKQFTVSAAYAKTKARVDRFNCPPGATCLPSGIPLPSAPDKKAVVRANWWSNVGNGLRLDMGADYTYSSAIQFDLSTSTNTIQPSYGIFNANVSLGNPSAGWRVSVVGKNLGDKSYAAFLLPGANTQRSVPRDDERYFGVSVRYEF
ncbi:MAG TPA: TonB-dependent receptor [Usitatibacteraceae bacterium]|nr:TonB-dependent receptor [Usitatibacteraceae bacterium]